MIYAQIIRYKNAENQMSYKLFFSGKNSHRLEWVDKWSACQNKRFNALKAESIEHTFFDTNGHVTSIDFILDYLSENKFIPVSETFFYKP